MNLWRYKQTIYISYLPGYFDYEKFEEKFELLSLADSHTEFLLNKLTKITKNDSKIKRK